MMVVSVSCLSIMIQSLSNECCFYYARWHEPQMLSMGPRFSVGGPKDEALGQVPLVEKVNAIPSQEVLPRDH